MIAGVRSEYERLSGTPEGPHACFRLVWTLVHSMKNSDVRRGLDLSEELLQSNTLDDQEQRDLVYLQSVGYYKLGKVLEARRQLDELLKVSPNFRQAQTLKAAVEDQIVKEGLVGIGLASALVGLAGVALGIAFARR
ncbi:probable mitochondrial fission 1 protein [Coccomyxa sp. Obi]|nr:probable mitochondrial fission 1 protein [Coccomyxa sp. Obi]